MLKWGLKQKHSQNYNLYINSKFVVKVEVEGGAKEKRVGLTSTKGTKPLFETVHNWQLICLSSLLLKSSQNNDVFWIGGEFCLACGIHRLPSACSSRRVHVRRNASVHRRRGVIAWRCRNSHYTFCTFASLGALRSVIRYGIVGSEQWG